MTSTGWPFFGYFQVKLEFGVLVLGREENQKL